MSARSENGTRTGPGRKFAIYAVLIIGVVPALLPLVWLFRSSLMGDGQIFSSPPERIPNPAKPENFSQVFDVQPFWRYLGNTLLIEAGVMVGMLLSCSLAAFSFSRLRWRGRDLVFVLTLSTLLLPYAVTIIPTFWMWRSVGAIDTLWPLIIPAWFGGAGMQGAFYIFLLRQFFMNIPAELDEAAYVDGASPWWVYWRIILPLSKPALATVAVFTFVNAWKDFLAPLIYLNSQENYTLALGLASFQGAYTGQWGLLMAASVMVLAPILLLFFLAQRYFIQGVSFGGGK